MNGALLILFCKPLYVRLNNNNNNIAWTLQLSSLYYSVVYVVAPTHPSDSFMLFWGPALNLLQLREPLPSVAFQLKQFFWLGNQIKRIS